MEKFRQLQNQLTKAKASHQAKWEGKGLDAVWIGVFMPKSQWRTAKKLGLEKDYYYGYKVYSTASNSHGYKLYETIKDIVKANPLFDIRVYSQDL